MVSFESRPYYLVALLCVAVLILVAPASAADVEMENLVDLSIEELLDVKVITASRKEEPIDEAPNVIYVVTKEQIKRRGYKTLQDIFQVIPGLGVFHRDLQFVGQVRGIAPNDNEKIAFMINGHIINQVTEPEVFAGGIRLDIFDRVEVIVGPGAVLYGGEPLCAIVNMITRKQDHHEAILSAGSFDSYTTTAMFGRQYEEGKNFFAAATLTRCDGFDAWLSDSPSARNQNLSDTTLTGKLYPSIVFFGEGEFGDWSLQFFSQNQQIPDLHLHGNNVADDGRRYDYIYSAVVRNNTQWTDNWSTSLKLFADTKRTLRSVVEVGSGSGIYPNWDLSQTSYGAEYAVQHRTDRNFFQAGVQAQLKQHRHNYDFQWDPDNPYTFDSNMRAIVDIEDTDSEGIYVSDDFWVNDKLKLVGAARCDRDTILGSDHIYTSPRAMVLYKPKRPWIMKLMYNRATRLAATPQGTPMNHLWGEDQPLAPSWANVNPHIERPEILNTVEFQNILYVGKCRLDFIVYRQTLKDFATWFSPRTNVGDFEGAGCELNIVTHLTDSFAVWGNAAYSDNDFTITAHADKSGEEGVEEVAEFQLPANEKGECYAVPRYTANLGFDWEVAKNFYASSTLRYFTRQPMNRFGTEAYADDRVYLDVATVWEEFLGEDMDLMLSAKNILDNRDPIGTQWLADAYKPRGTSVDLSLVCRF